MGTSVEHKFGLLGKDISYSFSESYFKEKFLREGRTDCVYHNYDLSHINELKEVLAQEHLMGLNVTIPYKEVILPFLDKIDPVAQEIGAVNTIKITPNGLVGYNTDLIGFKNSLSPMLEENHKKALVLGTGGASKAIAYALKQLEIEMMYVSRNPNKGQLAYSELTHEVFSQFQIIINCSPVGTYPNIEDKPVLPYEALDSSYIVYDLVYNPKTSALLKVANEKGAKIKNGYEMLVGQAEGSWKIWNET